MSGKTDIPAPEHPFIIRIVCLDCYEDQILPHPAVSLEFTEVFKKRSHTVLSVKQL